MSTSFTPPKKLTSGSYRWAGRSPSRPMSREGAGLVPASPADLHLRGRPTRRRLRPATTRSSRQLGSLADPDVVDPWSTPPTTRWPVRRQERLRVEPTEDTKFLCPAGNIADPELHGRQARTNGSWRPTAPPARAQSSSVRAACPALSRSLPSIRSPAKRQRSRAPTSATRARGAPRACRRSARTCGRRQS